ncbi:MAG: hypothetical protein ACJAVI_004892 [Candidatus Azotimanducaceae bacterium]|jgi:hypothetical protein
MNMRLPKLICTILCLPILHACSPGAGPAVQENLDLSSNAGSRSLVLNGPAPQTDDVQKFRLSLWENVAPENRCGECHVANGQSPGFARSDDINLAYDQVNSFVNLSEPRQSRLVIKVGEGHNCWLASNQACTDILTTWISNWAGDAAGSSNVIELRSPALKDPGASKSFPQDSTAFANTVHPLLMTYCANCHRDNAQTPQSPFFAVADVNAAYEAVRSRIEIDEPANSRLFLRLGSEFHNCWSDCDSNAAEMLSEIETLIASIPETEVDSSLVTSKALLLADGIVAAGGGRVDTNVVAFYEFKTLTGTTAFDTSGVEPAMNLSFNGDVSWVGGWGIRIGDNGKAQASTATSGKLHDLITSTGEYSIEAWVAPSNVTQEEARIVSYSAGKNARNFALTQTLYNYDFPARSSLTDGNGNPEISTLDGDEVLQATLQHVVATFDSVNGRQLFVNGIRIEVDDEDGGTLNDWDDTYAFVLGNEVSSDRLWRGVLRQVAIHNRALTVEQVRLNFEAGVGEQFYLLFGVSHLIDVPEAFVVFQLSQFDSYSYLFNSPFFVSLSDSSMPDNIPLQGMRIGINGREPEVGQAYRHLDLMLDGSEYEPGIGQRISSIGTILGIEKGVESDEFFLTFERLGDNANVVVEATPSPEAQAPDAASAPLIGVKTFDEINASMSVITTVPTSHPDVFSTFGNVRQQLPSLPGIDGFLSSQQMGVTQLAIEYCNVLVEDSALRQDVFPGFDFSGVPSSAWNQAGTEAFVSPLLGRVLGLNLSTQPNVAASRAELESLIQALIASVNPGSDNTAQRTRTIAKATCAATLGSAALLIQ